MASIIYPGRLVRDVAMSCDVIRGAMISLSCHAIFHTSFSLIHITHILPCVFILRPPSPPLSDYIHTDADDVPPTLQPTSVRDEFWHANDVELLKVHDSTRLGTT